MVTRMAELMMPYNLLLPHQEQPRHHPRITHRRANKRSFGHGPYATRPHISAKHLSHAAALYAKGLIKRLSQIRYGPRLGPQPAKKCGSVGNASLIKEKNFRVIWGLLGNAVQILDGLAAKQSAEVAEKDEQGGLMGRELVGQAAGLQVQPFDGLLPYCGGDVHSILR